MAIDIAESAMFLRLRLRVEGLASLVATLTIVVSVTFLITLAVTIFLALTVAFALAIGSIPILIGPIVVGWHSLVTNGLLRERAALRRLFFGLGLLPELVSPVLSVALVQQRQVVSGDVVLLVFLRSDHQGALLLE